MHQIREKKIIIGNWKMNPTTFKEAEKIFRAIKKHASAKKKARVVICSPFVFLEKLRALETSIFCEIGAQNVFWEKDGAYTGEISPAMLARLGVNYVIIGHSERRALGETNEEVAKKIRAVLSHGGTPIVCVGEKERDENGEHFLFIERELKESLANISSAEVGRIIIAYEPIWAIGKNASRSATPAEYEEMVIFIKRVLVDAFGKKYGLLTPIVYGGSVDDMNARAFLDVSHTSGLLVGRASLNPKTFNAIIDAAE